MNIWDSLLNFFTTIFPSFIWMALRTVGLGVGTYTGLEVIMTEVSNWIFTNWDGLSSAFISISALAGLDVAVKIIIAAYVMGFSIQTTLGAMKGFRFF